MSEQTDKPKPVGATGIRSRVALLLVSLMSMILAFAPAASAVEINFDAITVVLDNLSRVILPAFVSLVTAAVPIIIVLAVVGFIVTFLDRILAMIEI